VSAWYCQIRISTCCFSCHSVFRMIFASSATHQGRIVHQAFLYAFRLFENSRSIIGPRRLESDERFERSETVERFVSSCCLALHATYHEHGVLICPSRIRGTMGFYHNGRRRFNRKVACCLCFSRISLNPEVRRGVGGKDVRFHARITSASSATSALMTPSICKHSFITATSKP
jgi:hypothetical protein